MKKTIKKIQSLTLHTLSVSLTLIILTVCTPSAKNNRIEVLVIGGGTGGVAAGISSARMGCKTLIIEKGTWLGGMLTSAGVSAIDGNRNLPAGIWGEFRDSLVAHYGSLEALKSGWVSSVLFEPSVGDAIFKKMAHQEKRLEVWYDTELVSLHRTPQHHWIATLRSNNRTKRVEAKIVIDATEMGDVAAMCGVKYDIGMESRYDTKEEIAPSEANNIIQDLTYVAILKDYGRDVTLARPDGYDSTLFACACINELCLSPLEPKRMWSKEKLITYGKLPNNKYMINWPIEGNDFYVNMIDSSPHEREEAEEEAKRFTMHFIYFLQQELGFNTLGLADDEFPTQDRLPFTPYHRESRRIHGKVRFTLNDITHPYEGEHPLYRTTIAVGDYPVDHHHARYQGDETVPDLHFYPIPSYGVPLGTLIPKEEKGILVAEKTISVSNIANGTTRLQPVILQIGQASGILAATAVKNNIALDEVEVRDVQKAILNAKGYLLPYLDVQLGHPLFATFQRIGATGILQGVGESIGWSNQTWFRADSLLFPSALKGLTAIYPTTTINESPLPLTLKEALLLIEEIAQAEKVNLKEDLWTLTNNLFEKHEIEKKEPDTPITRGQFALLVDQLLDPFNHRKVDLYGQFK